MIVMLTKEEENQRVKCSHYFADERDDARTGGVLSLNDTDGQPALKVRLVEQKGLTEKPLAVRRNMQVWTEPQSTLGQKEAFSQYSQEHPYEVRSRQASSAFHSSFALDN